MLFHLHNMKLGLLLLGSVNSMGAPLGPHPTRSGEFHERILYNLDLGENCRDSRASYLENNKDFKPSCEPCSSDGFTESYSCQDRCSMCVGAQCERFSITQSWEIENGMMSHYLKNELFCWETTRGKRTGKKYCSKHVYDKSGDFDYCGLSIDDKKCDRCEYYFCAEEDGGYYDVVGDCTNLFADSTLNTCTNEYNGVFDSLLDGEYDVDFIIDEFIIDCNVQIDEGTNGFNGSPVTGTNGFNGSAATGTNGFGRVLWPFIGSFCITIYFVMI